MRISTEELQALGRFRDCCEDPDAGGHDVPKAMVQRLMAIGALRTLGFGRHMTTDYGDWVLAHPPAATAHAPANDLQDALCRAAALQADVDKLNKLLASVELPGVNYVSDIPLCIGFIEAKLTHETSPAPDARATEAAFVPYHLVETPQDPHCHMQVWKGRRRIANINTHAFSSTSAERQQAEAIINALNREAVASQKA
jgi:hypothetical protein